MICKMRTRRAISRVILIVMGLVASTAPASAQSGPPSQGTTTFLSGGEKIRLSRYEPRAEGKHPAIVLVHGLQSVEASKDALDAICQKYAARGYAVFLIHYFDRTKTSEKDLESMFGKFIAFLTADADMRDEGTLQKYLAWLDTVRDGLTHIRAQPNVDRERLALVGLSLGGYLSLTLAAEEDQQIAAVVSYFGGMPREVRARVKKLPPVQVIHGDKDLVVPVSEAHALKALADAKSFHLEAQIFPKAGHLFKGPQGDFQLFDALRADSATASFLSKHLKVVRQAQR